MHSKPCKVRFIAEAGVNHNGDVELAKRLIETAARAGADYCKFQSFRASSLVSGEAKKASYQATNLQGSDSQLDMLRGLELSYQDHIQLMEHCRKCGIEFLSTPFDEDSARMLHQMGLRILKIPSGEITNLPFIEFLAPLGDEFILSTGMANLEEIGVALDTLRSAKGSACPVTLLQCTSQYPTPDADVNLRAMQTLGREFSVPFGLSDHSEGIEISLAAAALGATIIEKHFTLDRHMEGPDHKASLEPAELTALVRGVRRIELALGDGVKRVMPSEMANVSVVRRSIHTTRFIAKGAELRPEDLCCKRPGDGLAPAHLHRLINSRALRDLPTDLKVAWEDFDLSK